MATKNMQPIRPFRLLEELVKDDIFPTVVHRVLLEGPPGTGKSSWPFYAFGDARCHRLTLHQQMPVEDLLGCKELEAGEQGGTSTRWCDGPAPLAMQNGSILILDEIDAYSPEIRCALHAVLDDREIACLEMPGGRKVRPKSGFGVVCTTNKAPSALPAPLLDRFDIVLHIGEPAPGLLDTLPENYQKVITAHYRNLDGSSWHPEISNRRLITLRKLELRWGPERAAKAVFGPNWSSMLTTLGVQA